MKKALKSVTILGLAMACVAPVFAGEDVAAEALDAKPAKVKKERKPKPEPVEMTIVGKLTKQEKKRGEKTTVSYVLTDGDGNVIALRQPKAPKKKKGDEAPAAPVVKLDDFVDADVTLVCKGTSTERDGKKRIQVREITSLDRVAAE